VRKNEGYREKENEKEVKEREKEGMCVREGKSIDVGIHKPI
jgi:hypothetical protein